MQKASGKLLIALTILIVILLVIFHFQNGDVSKPTAISENPAANSSAAPKIIFHQRQSATNERNDEALFTPASDYQISREKIEEWLTKRNRDAASLLTAYHALFDTNYLNEAATNFPNNSQVEMAVLARDEFPEDRRKWLDLFEKSSPSNSLANYFSAEDYFKNGNTNAALNEFLAADSKSQFDNFQIESQLNAEELAQFAGKSAHDTSEMELGCAITDDLGMNMTLRRLGNAIDDLQKQQLVSGNTESAENLASLAINLGDQVGNGDSGKYLINQLVGSAIEMHALSQLDQNASYDFLDGKTPSQVLQKLKQQRSSTMDLSSKMESLEPNMTDEETIDYMQRLKIYGEADAMRWAIQRHAADLQTNQ